ncbi:SOS response associated peptidase (SRAP) [Tahibacter aquaticus]|uniref:SOS response associated peptidase (SRAP) n=1 Tax=Tahibacter aquaticus TaxID=520092 RepID=A0A4V3DLA5_9GAMM|nr:SOS response associated peptidase (SRAP) [Tahibacter aquaticus]
MLAFWIDPDPNPAATRAAERAGSWEAVARSVLPSGRRVVRPLAGAFILVGAAQGPAVVRADWGLVPPGTKGEARRATAVRWIGLPAKRLTHAPFESLWASTARSWRCLVTATGWLAEVQGLPTACKPPAHPVALAGVFSRFENAEGKVIRTFGLVTSWRENTERFGHYGPIVINPRDAGTWVGKDPDRARGLLAEASHRSRSEEFGEGGDRASSMLVSHPSRPHSTSQSERPQWTCSHAHFWICALCWPKTFSTGVVGDPDIQTASVTHQINDSGSRDRSENRFSPRILVRSLFHAV